MSRRERIDRLFLFKGEIYINGKVKLPSKLQICLLKNFQQNGTIPCTHIDLLFQKESVLAVTIGIRN